MHSNATARASSPPVHDPESAAEPTDPASPDPASSDPASPDPAQTAQNAEQFQGEAPAEPTDSALVRATLAGDERAKETLFRRHAPLVFGLAHRVLGGRRDEVDDLAQDAFLQAFASLSKLRDPQAFAKWLGSIVIHTARRHIRRKAVRRKFFLERKAHLATTDLVSTDAPPDVQAELRALYNILDTMPTEARIALVLRRVEGFTLPEIAEHMGRSLATVKRRIRAAESLLASHLEKP